MRIKLLFHRLTHWEYWNIWAIYLPLFPIWLYLSLKAKSLLFFSTSNPSIEFGGMAMESKMDIYNIIPKQYIPKTIFIDNKKPIDEILNKITNWKYPLIIKPDIGLKGLGVFIVNNSGELISRLNETDYNAILQEKINYEKEIGIFYHRYPDEKEGTITGLVEKEFLHIIGDGKKSVRELIVENPRAEFQINYLQKSINNLDQILKKGEKQILVPFGSHTRGAKFINYSHLLNENLKKTINNIAIQIDGFYYGRLDVMYDNFEELCLGEKFKIIEINGAKSEPTHMYDPKHSLFFAWKEIIKHWSILNQISIINHKKGFQYYTIKKGFKALNENLKIEKKLKKISHL